MESGQRHALAALWSVAVNISNKSRGQPKRSNPRTSEFGGELIAPHRKNRAGYDMLQRGFEGVDSIHLA